MAEWFQTFSYKQHSKGICDRLKYMSAYLWFLWNADEHQLGILHECSKHNSTHALELAYTRVAADYTITQDKQKQDNQRIDDLSEDISGIKDKTLCADRVKEIADETARWKARGLSDKEIELRRTPTRLGGPVVTREDQLNEPIVYIKDIGDGIKIIAHDKIAGFYTLRLEYELGDSLKDTALYPIATLCADLEDYMTVDVRFARNHTRFQQNLKAEREAKAAKKQQFKQVRVNRLQQKIFANTNITTSQSAFINKQAPAEVRENNVHNVDGSIRQFTVLENTSTPANTRSSRPRRNRQVDIDHVKAAMGQMSGNDDINFTDDLF